MSLSPVDRKRDKYVLTLICIIAFIATFAMYVFAIASRLQDQLVPGWIWIVLAVATGIVVALATATRRWWRPPALPPPEQQLQLERLTHTGQRESTVHGDKPSSPPHHDEQREDDDSGVDPVDGDADLVVASTRYHWFKLFWPTVATASAVGGLVFVAAIGTGSSLNWLVAIVLLAGTAVLILLPYYEYIERLYRRIQALGRIKHLRWRVAAVAAIVLAPVIWLIAALDIGYGWVAPLLSWLVNSVWFVVRHAFASPTSLMVVVVILALVKELVVFVDWWVNKIYRTKDELKVRSGLIKRTTSSMDIDDITDRDVSRWWFNPPWCTLRVESPGQHQGINTVHYVPINIMPKLH